MSAQPIGVCIIVLDSHSRVLLGKRKNSYRAGMYGLPGGRVEHKEALVEAARRELAEETALIPVDLAYVGVIREVQEQGSFIHFVYVCREFQGTPATTEPEKCEGWEWFPPEKLPHPLLPGHSAALNLLKNPDPSRMFDLT